MGSVRLLVCPYCGETQPPGDVCRRCRGAFDEGSRRASLNAMGPWFLRDPKRPFLPGCSYETMVQRAERGDLTAISIIRGPTTKQLWAAARRVPAIAHLVGYCHACDDRVARGSSRCSSCNAVFGAWMDRNQLGLPDIQLLDGPVPIPEPPVRTTALARRVPMRASAVNRTRPVGRVPGLTLDMDPPKTSGTWTAIVGGLVIALVAVVLVPVGIVMLGSDGEEPIGDDTVAMGPTTDSADDDARRAARVEEPPRAGELPAGTFRPSAPTMPVDPGASSPAVSTDSDSGTGSDTGSDTGTDAAASATTGGDAPAASPDAPGDTSSDAPPAIAPADGSPVDPADDVTAASGGADDSDPMDPSNDPDPAIDDSAADEAIPAAPGSVPQRIRALRAIAIDDAQPWTDRTEAWRGAAALIVDTRLAPGERLPMTLDVLRGGFDRTLVDAFASGAPLAELLAADQRLEAIIGPPDRR